MSTVPEAPLPPSRARPRDGRRSGRRTGGGSGRYGGRYGGRHGGGRRQGRAGYALSALLTLILLPVAASVLVTALRQVAELDEGFTQQTCTGAQMVGPALILLPVGLLAGAVLGALVSLARRGRGWVWLLATLVLSVLGPLAAWHWLPGCIV